MSELAPHLRSILELPIPRFSRAEMRRRRAAIEALLAAHDCDHLVFCGANRVGSAVQWLTQWPVTAEAVGVMTPGERDALFVQYVNHVPQARLIADEADVSWGGESSIAAAIEALEKRGARQDRVATLGPLSIEQHAALAAKFGRLASLNRDYLRLRQVKSVEECDWLRIGAYFSDRGMQALRAAIRPGVSERELGDAVERAYVGQGGTTGIHYIGTTSMAAPDLAVPRQFPTTRRIETGDVIVAEITAAFWDHPGQVLRSFALGEPTGLYRDLHAAAGDRSRRRDRGCGLHHHRRSSAGLRRRLPAADPRQQKPPGRSGPRGALPRRADGGYPAQRRHPRPHRGRADGRDGADNGNRRRALACRAARLCAALTRVCRARSRVDRGAGGANRGPADARSCAGAGCGRKESGPCLRRAPRGRRSRRERSWSTLHRSAEGASTGQYRRTLRLGQLFLHPIGALRTPAIGAVGGDMVAVLD